MHIRRVTSAFLTSAAILALAVSTSKADGDEPKNIKDNSFLIEEAYNQEKGVAQHIFNWVPSWDHDGGDHREFSFLYTIELPMGGETNQFSFTPMNFEHFVDDPDGGPRDEQGGWGDTFVNYRYQLVFEDENGWQPAVAPRFSLILPTGDENRGLGVGVLGYQFNLPISKELERFAFHFNAGTTLFPNASVDLAGGGDSSGRDLHGYNVGGSAIWLASYDVNFLLEFVTYWQQELDDVGRVDNTTTILLDPGVRAALYTSDEIQWVVGLGTPIGLSQDAPDISLFIYMSIEHKFRHLD